ncbi:MAG TPA: cysteine desulfurase-like protein [Actinomycetota bacterium]|nr:cysteine desulfurase-like protein [Actinomycetota bacterium]
MATPQTTTSLDVQALRARFPALGRSGPDGRPFVWADAPGGSQAPESVIAAIGDRMRAGQSNTHGAFPVSAEVDALIDQAHRAGADFLGCDRDEVVFGQNATSLLLHVSRSFARTLRPGDEVVVTRLDHDANVRPWVLAARDAGATVRWVDVRPHDVTLDVDSFDAQLSERTRLVAFTLASNAVGTVPPAADLIARAKAVGALVALDGVHAAQHRLIDLHGLGADLVATSPYKFFGPHQGMLGVRRELLETWEPYKLRPVEDVDPDRWETGTQSHEAMAGTAAAIEYIAGATGGGATRRAGIEASFAAFAAHERELSRRFLAGVAEIEGVRLVGIADPARVDERTPTFAVRVGGQAPAETSRALADLGVFTWEGHYYAIEVFDRLGLLASGGAVRIGFCHYHTLDEVDRVLDALEVVGRRS